MPGATCEVGTTVGSKEEAVAEQASGYAVSTQPSRGHPLPLFPPDRPARREGMSASLGFGPKKPNKEEVGLRFPPPRSQEVLN